MPGFFSLSSVGVERINRQEGKECLREKRRVRKKKRFKRKRLEKKSSQVWWNTHVRKGEHWGCCGFKASLTYRLNSRFKPNLSCSERQCLKKEGEGEKTGTV